MIKICIADNHPVVIQGIKSYFSDNSQMNIVATSTTFEELQNALQSKTIDIVILDLELEGVSSIRDIKSLIKEFTETKFVLFTSVSEKCMLQQQLKQELQLM